jgi:integrase
VSKSQVSRICADLDTAVEEFRGRRLDHVEFPYVFLDATYVKAHEGARVVSKAIVVATGVAGDPHSLRHSFITAALDAGVPLRDVQEAASHPDPRTTMRYDRGRGSLDRHATYIVATFVAGVSR